MRGWLERRWYGSRGPAFLLPLAAVYRGAQWLRAGAYRSGLARTVRVTRPVVIVGNLSVGGTGKTPLVAWLVQALAARGTRAAIVSRGYGRKETALRVVGTEDSWREVGDEPLLLAAQTGAPVVVGRDRVAAARRAIELGAEVVIADDGLQHLRLARDFEIVVLDGTRGFGNGRVLPAGPLREPPARLRTVDAAVFHLTGAEQPFDLPQNPALTVTMRLAVEGVLRTDGWRRHAASEDWVRAAESLEAYRGSRVHAVAGIGNPARFFALLREHGVAMTEHAFPDHHVFSPSDLDFGDAVPVLMTEKDAVKCAGFGDPRLRYVRVRARLDEPGATELLSRVVQRLQGEPTGR